MKELEPSSIHPVVFIKEVEKRPELYKGDALDRERKLELWTEVGEVVFKDWSTLNRSAIHDRLLLLQRRWKSFRDTYNRELRQRRRGTKPHRRVYKFYKHLKFLGGHEDLPEEPVDDIEVEDDAIYFQLDDSFDEGPVFKEEPNYDDEDYEPPNNKKRSNLKRPKPKKKRMIEVLDQSLSEEVPLSVPVYAEDDGDRLFMLSFLSEMKNLPVNIKMWARSQISNVMQEAVMSSLNNTQPGLSGHSYQNSFQDRASNAERKSLSSSD